MIDWAFVVVCNRLRIKLRLDAVGSQLANVNVTFIWKLHCHWFWGLRQRQIAVVIQAPMEYMYHQPFMGFGRICWLPTDFWPVTCWIIWCRCYWSRFVAWFDLIPENALQSTRRTKSIQYFLIKMRKTQTDINVWWILLTCSTVFRYFCMEHWRQWLMFKWLQFGLCRHGLAVESPLKRPLLSPMSIISIR